MWVFLYFIIDLKLIASLVRVKCTIGGVLNTLFGFISTVLKIKVLSIEVVDILSLQELGVTTGFKFSLNLTSSCFLDYLSEWKMT